MGERRNKRIVEANLKAWMENDTKTLATQLAPGFRAMNTLPGFGHDAAGYLEAVRRYHEAFSGLRATVRDIYADKDAVTIRFGVEARHTGTFMGAPATGRKVHLDVVSVLKLRDGRVTEDDTEFDTYAFMAQIGAIPQIAAVAP